MSRFVDTHDAGGNKMTVDIENIALVDEKQRSILLKNGYALRTSDKGVEEVRRAIASSGLAHQGLLSQIVSGAMLCLVIMLLSFVVCQAASIEWTWMIGLGVWASAILVRFAMGGRRK